MSHLPDISSAEITAMDWAFEVGITDATERRWGLQVCRCCNCLGAVIQFRGLLGGMMMRDGLSTLEQARDAIGLDAYRLYPDSRRLIPEAVALSVAAACISEFIKGFVDFKSLGERANQVLTELIRRWRTKDRFEEFVTEHDPTAVVTLAIQHLPLALPAPEAAEAQRRLQEGLEEFGLSASKAADRAAEIAKIIAKP